MVIGLNEGVFVAKHTPFCHNDQVKHLSLAFLYCVRIRVLLQQEISLARADLILFIEHLLYLCTAIFITFLAQHDDLLGHFELTIDDEINAICPVTLFIKHPMSVNLL